MKTLKRIVLLVILVAVAYGALWAYQSPLFSLYEIKDGLDTRDVVRVERYADLEKLVQAGAQVLGALAKEKVGVNNADHGGGDVGSQILGAIIGGIAGKVGEATSIEGAMQVRRAIQEGRMKPAVGPFVVDEGWGAVADYQRVGSVSFVDVRGRCNAKEATLRLVFEDRPGNVVFLTKSVLVGVDEASLTI